MKANGEVQEISPKNGKKFSLQELQGFVEGYIELVWVGEMCMVVNEEGKLNRLEINNEATRIYNKHHGFSDIIVGNVMLAYPDEID